MTTAESEEQYLQYVFCDEVNFFTIFVSNHGSLCGPSVSAQHNSVLQVRGGGLDYHITYEWGEGVGQITRVGGGCGPDYKSGGRVWARLPYYIRVGGGSGPDYHITYEWGEGVGRITILDTIGGGSGPDYHIRYDWGEGVGRISLLLTTHLEHTASDGGPSLDWLGEGHSRASQSFIPGGWSCAYLLTCTRVSCHTKFLGLYFSKNVDPLEHIY